MKSKLIKSLVISTMIIASSGNAFAAKKHGHTKKDGLVKAGDILQFALPAAALGMTMAKGDDEGRTQFFKSFLITTGATHAIKLGAGNTSLCRRPNGGRDSFPSGHTSSAFQGAFFLQHRYGSQYGLPALGLATLTGISRVHGKYHHKRDVVAGAALAGIVSYFTVSSANERLTVSAATENRTTGLSMSVKL